MDHIAAASEELFTAQDFGDAPSSYEMLEVIPNAPARPENTHELRISSTSFHQAAVDAFDGGEQDSNGEPALKLVKIQLEAKVTSRFNTMATEFIDLFRAFKIHPYTLYLMSMNIVSYQQFGQLDGQCAPNNTYYRTYYVNYDALKIIWS